MPRSALRELLDAGWRRPPEYGGGLSDHLPMALCALHALGAPDERLQRFAAGYAPRLGAPAALPEAGLPLEAWADHLGRVESYPALLAATHGALLREGPDAVLRSLLPQLLPGAAGAAFHGLIRTAYAAESGHLGELAAGLAYWACRHLPLAAPGDAPPLDAADWLAALAASAPKPPPSQRLISERIIAVAAQPGFAAFAGRLAPQADTLAWLSAFAVEAYAATGNFTVLHMVTGCHALRVLMPWIADPRAALRDASVAFAAALHASGAAHAERRPAVPQLDWPEVIERALASPDEHVIKLVHSCRADGEAYANPATLQAAARVVERQA